MKPYILVEPFCGMAALSFALMGCQPPISWMGSKRGYTRVLMELLGLSRHHPPAAFIWSDVGPNVAALATLSGARGDARDVAGWAVSSWWSIGQIAGAGGFNTNLAYPSKWGDGIRSPETTDRIADRFIALPRAPEVAAIIRGWKDKEPRALWERLKAAGWPSLMPPKGTRWGQPVLGRWLGPCDVREVAGWLMSQQMQHPGTEMFSASKVEAQFGGANGHGRLNRSPVTPEKVADMTVALPSRWPRVAAYQGTATRLVEQLPERLDNVVAYLDPPYENTTGYKFGGCPRSEVLRMAPDLSARGATVAISEAVRLDRELGEGWTAVQIDGERRGQKRTFSVQQSEWVTMNRAPSQVPGQQQGLFGGGR